MDLTSDIRAWTGVDLTASDLIDKADLDRRELSYAFLTGSLVEGFGNASSDLDIYVVLRGDSAARPEVRFANIGSRRVDVEVWYENQVSALSSRLHALTFDGTPSIIGAITAVEQRFLWRAAVGRCLSGPDGFDVARDLGTSQQFARYLVATSLYRALEAAEDASGMAVSQDWASAVLRAQDMLGYALDAYLQSAGFLNPNAKWRLNGLRNIAAKGGDIAIQLEQDYRALRFNCVVDIENWRPYVERCFAVSNELMQYCRRDV